MKFDDVIDIDAINALLDDAELLVESAISKKHFISRREEVSFLKKEINALLKEIGVSKRMFHRTLPRMTGAGYAYKVNPAQGGKSSLRQKYAFLLELKESLNEKKIEVEYGEDKNEK